MNEFEQWWASANTRLTDLPKAQAKFIWDAAQNKQAEPVAVDHSDLIKRIEAAIERVTQGRGLMSIPADPRSDVDLVLSECKALLQGENPPFWAKDFHPAPAVAQPPAVAVNEQLQPYTSDEMQGRFAFQPKHIGGWLVDQKTGRTYEPSFAKEYALAMLDAIAAAEGTKGGAA